MKPSNVTQLHFFDFLRGWAALLVFLHHASLLGGGPDFLSNGHVGEEAVNAFMFASGFLIYYQCASNIDYAGFDNRHGFYNFYIRRYFRIAPVYYVALIAALFAGPMLGDARQLIATHVSGSETDLSRYIIQDIPINFLMHVSFVFGLFPQYAFSTPLTDLSLGLEMQFYLLFPFIFIILRKNFFVGLLVLLTAFLAIRIGFKIAEVVYPMPSFLPLKFHNFAAGMAIAFLYLNRTHGKLSVLALILLFVAIGERSPWMPLILGVSFLILIYPESRITVKFDWLFNNRLNRWLADVSYSVYILHLLLVIPFFAWTIRHTSTSLILWWLAVGVLLCGVFLLSWLILHVVERPGIRLGKRLLRRQTSPGEYRSNALG